jgi:lysozyme
MSPNGRASLQKMLIRQEGLRLKPYRDSRGFETIGYGHNLSANGISASIASEILLEDTLETIHQLNLKLPWYSELNEARQSALISICFNLGINGLLEFHQTLDALKNNNWQLAHNNVLLSEAAQQDKLRYQEIATIFLTGELT